MVIINSDLLGKSGMETKVTKVDSINNSIIVKDSNQVSHEINLFKSGTDLSVYEEKISSFTKGDKVVFLKNDKSLKINNGQTAEIINVENNGKVRFQLPDKTVKTINVLTQYQYFSHGYALTDYKSQGQTAKNVIYHADTSRGVNFNQAYVGITRGSDNIAIFTDDKEQLKRQITQEQQKSTIHEFEHWENSKLSSKSNFYESKVNNLSMYI